MENAPWGIVIFARRYARGASPAEGDEASVSPICLFYLSFAEPAVDAAPVSSVRSHLTTLN